MKQFYDLPWLQERRSEANGFDAGNTLSNFAQGKGNLDYNKLYNLYNEPASVNTNLFASAKPKDLFNGFNDALQEMARIDRNAPGQGLGALVSGGLSNIVNQKKAAAQAQKEKQLKTFESLLGLAGQERKFGLEKEKLDLDKLLQGNKHNLDTLYRQAQIAKTNAQLQNLSNPEKNVKMLPATTLKELNQLMDEALIGEEIDPATKIDLLAKAEDEYQRTHNLSAAIKNALQDLQEEETISPALPFVPDIFPGWLGGETKSTKKVLGHKVMPSTADIDATQAEINAALKQGVPVTRIKDALKAKGYNQNILNKFSF